jgi:hypothetical protein
LSEAYVRIWIYRNGSGCLRVSPSPATAAHGDHLRFRNLTDSAATVHFNLRDAIPPVLEGIGPGATADLALPAAGDPGVHEYGVEVHSARGSEHAEGGSRPSIIIDP